MAPLQANELLLDLLHLLIAQVETLRGSLAAGTSLRLALEDAIELLNAVNQVFNNRAFRIKPFVSGDQVNSVISPGLCRRLVTGLEFIKAKRKQQLGEV